VHPSVPNGTGPNARVDQQQTRGLCQCCEIAKATEAKKANTGQENIQEICARSKYKYTSQQGLETQIACPHVLSHSRMFKRKLKKPRWVQHQACRF
jgi:hypothetical protein